MSRHLAAAAALLLACVAALAADLDANEKKWVRTCMESLSAKSERVRGGAERALAEFGPDALGAMLECAPELKSDDEWHAFSRALAGMGGGGSTALDLARAAWPQGVEKRLADVLDEVRALEAKAKADAAIGAAAPASPAEVRAKVQAILEELRNSNVSSSDDPHIARIVQFGRPAIGVLVEVLREKPDIDGLVRRTIAARALAQLVEDQDVALIAGLVREGVADAGTAFERLRTPTAIDAIVDLVGHGHLDSDLVSALDGGTGSDDAIVLDPRIVTALCAWLKKPVGADDLAYLSGRVAELLGRSGDASALPAILPLLRPETRVDARRDAAKAVVRLGDKSGIPVLIEILGGPRSGSFGLKSYDSYDAGRSLNELTGKEFLVAKEDPPGGVPTIRFEGNFEYAAAAAYEAWWKSVQDKLRFDPATRTWRE